MELNMFAWCLLSVATAEYTRISSSQAIWLNGYQDSAYPWAGPGFEKMGRDWDGLCASGLAQSPIDITEYPANPDQYQVVTASNSTFRPLVFSNSPSSLYLQDNGLFDFVWIYQGTVTQTVNEINVEEVLALIIFHAPAEHTIRGVRYPLGVLLEYSGVMPDGSITFGYQVYVVFREGRRNVALDQFINQEPMDVSFFLPPNGVLDDYYYYIGSFDIPVPGCIENIPWVISNYVMEAAPEQIQHFQDLYVNDLSFSNGVGDIRAIQPLNDRVLYHFIRD